MVLRSQVAACKEQGGPYRSPEILRVHNTESACNFSAEDGLVMHYLLDADHSSK